MPFLVFQLFGCCNSAGKTLFLTAVYLNQARPSSYKNHQSWITRQLSMNQVWMFICLCLNQILKPTHSNKVLLFDKSRQSFWFPRLTLFLSLFVCSLLTFTLLFLKLFQILAQLCLRAKTALFLLVLTIFVLTQAPALIRSFVWLFQLWFLMLSLKPKCRRNSSNTCCFQKCLELYRCIFGLFLLHEPFLCFEGPKCKGSLRTFP